MRRLEHTFQIAYGRDGTLPETWDALLYSQLQEGLSHRIMEAPAVSGTADYQALGLTGKNAQGTPTGCVENQTVIPSNCATSPRAQFLKREPPIQGSCNQAQPQQATSSAAVPVTSATPAIEPDIWLRTAPGGRPRAVDVHQLTLHSPVEPSDCSDTGQ